MANQVAQRLALIVASLGPLLLHRQDVGVADIAVLVGRAGLLRW